MYSKTTSKHVYTVFVQPNVGINGQMQPMVVNSEGEIVVDSEGYILTADACQPYTSTNCVNTKTTTSGIQEAIYYAYNTGGLHVDMRSGSYIISSALVIPANININFDNAQIKLSSNFASSDAILINGEFVELYNLTLDMNNVPNVGGIRVSSSFSDNFTFLTMKNVKIYNFTQGYPYNQVGIYLTGYDILVEDIQLSGNPTIGMMMESGGDIFINNLLIANSSSALQVYGCEHIFLSNVDLDSNGSQYTSTSVMIIDTSHSILVDNLSIWFNGSIYNYQNYQGSIGLQIGSPNTTYTSNSHNTDIQINNLNIIDANVTYGLVIYDGTGIRIKGFIGNPQLFTNIYPISTGISFQSTNSTAVIQYNTVDVDYYQLSQAVSDLPPVGNYNSVFVRPPFPPTTPSVGASGTATYNYNPFSVLVYLYGGSVTEIQVTKALDATTYTVFSSSSGVALSGNPVRLDPGDSITVTYSSAPSWVWTPIAN